ncbi:hypothetical protein BX661DRAFT_199438 [Kickxella alabastrina]|uniref:uncharacterized protein n=1 Tax=Kickxella alabastrina TaxID=61397 RepID=UPI00221E9E69|nr:uncharacterized protein BX661DRAFT_199438 [Kickxella alabastrina]KAI7824907.1 hypothetical protein BX661DRAFT_199438 [Kickxella alabastrina]
MSFCLKDVALKLHYALAKERAVCYVAEITLRKAEREFSEIRGFCAQEEAARIATESACASMGVAMANLELALSAADAAQTDSLATHAEVKRKAEAACSEVIELAVKNTTGRQRMANINGQLDAAKQQNRLLQEQVQVLQRGANNHVHNFNEIHDKLPYLRKVVANYSTAAAGGQNVWIYCSATLCAATASELARR